MKNIKGFLFCLIAIIVVIAVAIFALTLSGNSGAFYLCIGIVIGVLAIIIMKYINYRKNSRK